MNMNLEGPVDVLLTYNLIDLAPERLFSCSPILPTHLLLALICKVSYFWLPVWPDNLNHSGMRLSLRTKPCYVDFCPTSVYWPRRWRRQLSCAASLLVKLIQQHGSPIWPGQCVLSYPQEIPAGAQKANRPWVRPALLPIAQLTTDQPSMAHAISQSIQRRKMLCRDQFHWILGDRQLQHLPFFRSASADEELYRMAFPFSIKKAVTEHPQLLVALLRKQTELSRRRALPPELSMTTVIDRESSSANQRKHRADSLHPSRRTGTTPWHKEQPKQQEWSHRGHQQRLGVELDRDFFGQHAQILGIEGQARLPAPHHRVQRGEA